MNRVGFVNHLLLTVAVRMPQLTDNVLRTPLSKITSTGEIEQRFRLN